MQHAFDGLVPSTLPDEPAGPASPATPGPEVLAWQEDQLSRSRNLVDALTDQYAAGQVEALYGLHAASAAVRRETREVTELLAQLTDMRQGLEQTMERVTTRVGETLSKRLAAQVDESLQVLLVERLQPFAHVLMETASGAGETIAAAAQESAEVLISLSGDLEARLNAAHREADDRLAKATGALEKASAGAERRLSRAAEAAVSSLAAASDHVTSVSAETIDGIEHVSRSVAATLDTMTDEFLAELASVLNHQRKREERAETDRENRVQKLVARADASFEQVTERLRRETDWLAARDERQEQLRADAFVSALETLLDQSSGKLRSRVREVIGLERRRRDDQTGNGRAPDPAVAIGAAPPIPERPAPADPPRGAPAAAPSPKPAVDRKKSTAATRKAPAATPKKTATHGRTSTTATTTKATTPKSAPASRARSATPKKEKS